MNARGELNRLFSQDPAVLLENLPLHQGRPPRLRLGPYTLALVRLEDGVTRWALPGGDTLTYGECGRLARQRGWPRPELLPAAVSGETGRRA